MQGPGVLGELHPAPSWDVIMTVALLGCSDVTSVGNIFWSN